MRRLEKQKLTVFLLASLVIYWLLLSWFVPDIVEPGLRQPFNFIGSAESSLLDNKNYPVSLPVRLLNRGSTIFAPNPTVGLREVLPNPNHYVQTELVSAPDNTHLSKLEAEKISSRIISSLNTIFILVNGQACQHLDTSPPSY